MAPLQKRAWWGLVTGIIFAAALLIVFIVNGDVTRFDEELGYRIPVYILWIGGLVAYLVIMNLTLRRQNQIDERDKLILDRATKLQLGALIVTLVIWTVSLTVAYSDDRAVPVVFLYLIFISIQIINIIAQSLGIIIGYWRMDRYGEG